MKNLLKSIAIGAASSILFAQSTPAQAPEMPKPGPEHQRLGYFVGEWKGEGEAKPGPMGPGGKVTSTDKCEWFDGKFAVVCRSEVQCPLGATKHLSTNSYSTEEKMYTYYGTDNMGMTMTSVALGTVKGDTWTYSADGKMDGKDYKTRVIIREVSPTAYTFAMDMQGPDGKWARAMDAKYTKVK